MCISFGSTLYLCAGGFSGLSLMERASELV